MNECSCHSIPPAPVDRRGFLKRTAAILISAVLGAIPLGAGLAVFFDPLRRKSVAGGMVRVATLEALPADGIPRKFPVLASRVDAWNRFAEVPVGAVYLRRTVNGVEALNVVCPHAGCFIDFIASRGSFLCPCHNSAFTIEGRIADASSPSPRAMDSLTVEVRNEKEVWVKFENFKAGRPDRVSV